MKTKNGIYTTNAYGIQFSTMSKEELNKNLESMILESKKNWFYNEGLRYQKTHKKTREYILSLIESK